MGSKLRSIRGRASAGAHVVVLLATVAAGPAVAQTEAFRHDPSKIDPGIVYLYRKSNVDGSHASDVALYVASSDRLESFKWTEGHAAGTLVVALIDWKRFSVRHFETYRIHADGRREQRVVMDQDDEVGGIAATAGDLRLQAKIEHWPWHSYDFDFASLNFTWRHLVDPEKPFRVGVTDFASGPDGPAIVDKGWVEVTYQATEMREGTPSRRYAIDGDGLANRGGLIWVRKGDGVVVDYEIDLPDEDGFESGKLRWVGERKLSAAEWEAFQAGKLSAAP